MAIVLVVAAVLPPPYLLYAVGGTGLIWLFHWDNIVRLIRGQERRIGPPSGSA
jgi:glycerol-3-phosphate acyltransferase PlsY